MNKKLIVNWNEKRVIKSETKKLFKEVGNFFSFTINEPITEKLHVYFGINNAGQSFYIIKESQDTKENQDFLAFVPLANTKKRLPNFETKHEDNPNRISWNSANMSINNWISDEIRNAWLDNQFSKMKGGEAIFLAFVVDAIDIMVGEKHECYFSLKECLNKSFEVDLIVVNETRGIISKNIEDMVHSVPPFGDDYAKFGLLKSLHIQ